MSCDLGRHVGASLHYSTVIVARVDELHASIPAVVDVAVSLSICPSSTLEPNEVTE